MRIVGGDFGGRPLKAVPGNATRPTTDKVKEAIFNMIGPYFDGGRSLDLYAGSGGLSIEGVSRGIEQAVLVDQQRAAVKTIQQNVAMTKAPEQFTVYQTSANRAISKLTGAAPFNLFYFDPPYAKQMIIQDVEQLIQADLVADSAILMAETDQFANLPDTIQGFQQIKQKDYGITVITIYEYVRS